MRKIVTPTQCPSALDGLNALRPLVLSDEVKQLISVPVVDQLAVGSEKSASGKLLRCTPQGSTLIKNVDEWTNYQVFNYDYDSFDGVITVTFSQRVYKVMIHRKTVGIVLTFYWSDPTGAKDILDITDVGFFYCNFVGSVMYIRLFQLAPPNIQFDVYGFY